MCTDYENRVANAVREKIIFSKLTHRIGKELITTDDSQKILELINSSTAQTTQASASAIWILDEKDKKYKTVAIYGNYPPLFKCKPYTLEKMERILKKLQFDKFGPGETYAGYVARTKNPLFLNDLSAKPSEHVEQTASGIIDIENLVTVPVILEKECIAVMSVINKTTAIRSFSTSDLSMMNTLANQAAFAVNQIQLHKKSLIKKMEERDIHIAADIQQDLLPKSYATSAFFDFHGFSYSAKGVGGDFYSYQKFSDKSYGMVMSDVAGKGVPAALVMVMLRSIFAVLAKENKPPNEIIRVINATITGGVTQDRYATFFYYVFDADKMEIMYSNAANQPLLLYRKEEDSFEELDASGMPLGIMENSEYEIKSSKVSKGDILVLYTDGITEAMDSNRFQFELSRLKDHVRRNAEKKAKEISQEVYKAVSKFSGDAPQHDDQTLFISKIL